MAMIQQNMHHIEAGLVGSLLVDPDKVVSVADVVALTDFTDEKAQLAYGAIIDTWKSRQPVNLLTIAKRLNTCPGIASYLGNASSCAFPPSVRQFAHDIAEAARFRRVRAAVEAASKATTPQDLLNDLMEIYRAEMRSGKKAPDMKSVMARFNGVVTTNREQGKVGFRTGFSGLDGVYARFAPGHIWTVGGFTSVGKTASMVQMICNAIAGGETPSIVLISTEMTEEQVVARIVANFTGVPSFRVLSGNFHTAEEADSVEKIKALLAGYHLAIHDDIYQLTEIETAVHKADLRGGVDIAVIDYVQNCKWKEAKSQYQEQSELAKRFQVLAKDTRSTLICLSQVSNDVGRGVTDQLELKGAGEWAAVSDYSIMLSRHKTEKHRLMLDLKKNRHGALTKFELEYKNEYTRLEERRV